MSKLFQFSSSAAILLAATLLVFSSCKTESSSDSGIEGKAYENKMTDYLTDSPHQLNPYNRTDATSTMLMKNIYQSLLYADVFSYEVVPQLAKAVPTPVVRADGKTELPFEIKDGAKWDNGTEITGEDVAFSLKIMKLPEVENPHMKPYFEYVEDIVIDKDNPKKFTLICKEPYMLMVSALEDFIILPSYVYDEAGVLKNYTAKQIAQGGNKIEKDANLIKAAENFNSPKFQNKIIVGSGPYKFVEWQAGQRIILELKKDWWGKKYENESHWFQAFPEKITYEIITDPTTAVVALKSEKIDAIYRVDPHSFVQDLQKSEEFKSKYNIYTPTQFLYSYIGMNMRNPKFDDVRVRRAMRYIMDNKNFHDQVFYGMAEQVTSFIHPSKKKFVNTDLKVIEQDIEKARSLMAEAGWKDTNGNGVLDKEINGETVEFEVDFLYPNAAKTSEKGVLMFQEAARKVNLKINPTPLDFKVMVTKTKAHNFDMFYGIWVSPATESDPKQIWHTDSYNGGSNYVGFGNAETNALIDALRKELNETKRAEIYKKLQAAIDKDAPYIFMLATQNRVAVHKKFGEIKDTGVNPGYFSPSLQVQNVISQ